MSRISDNDESRRQFLLLLLSAGALGSVTGLTGYSPSARAAPLPSQMPAGSSIHLLEGDVRVNGKPALLTTFIKPGDTIETFGESFVIFVVQKDAFILRSNSKMTLPSRDVPTGTVTTAYSLERGKALSVLASRHTNISTPSALINVRGTGVYVESEPDASYVCVCYGTSDLRTADDPTINETIVSEHHTAPKYILADRSASQRIIPAPFKNHDDEELLLIETLVGRTTPYIVPRGITRSRNTYF